MVGDGLLSEGRYRDRGLYISHVKDGTNVDDTFMMEEQNLELQAAVMDLTAEDKDGGWARGGAERADTFVYFQAGPGGP